MKDSVISSSVSTSMKSVEEVQESMQDPDMVIYASQLSLKVKSQLNGNLMAEIFNKNKVRRTEVSMLAGEKDKSSMIFQMTKMKLLEKMQIFSMETLLKYTAAVNGKLEAFQGDNGIYAFVQEPEQIEKLFQAYLRRVDNLEDCKSLLVIEGFKKEIKPLKVVTYEEGGNINNYLKKKIELETEDRLCLNIKYEEDILEEIIEEKSVVLNRNERIFVPPMFRRKVILSIIHKTYVECKEDLGLFEVNGVENMSIIEEKVNKKLKEYCFGTQTNKRRMVEDLQLYYKRRKTDLEKLQPDEPAAAIGVNEGHVMSSIVAARSVIDSSDGLMINPPEPVIPVERSIDRSDTDHADDDLQAKDIGKDTSSNKVKYGRGYKKFYKNSDMVYKANHN